ncbi:MAG: metallophosphoesterase [Deltaproteobacteria bacterium]|nr:metallophosphoesterase [Deltaproteobacteria bacterium]
MQSFRLAHLTDPHFRSFEGAFPSVLVGKRVVGALNILVNRRRKHRMELLEKLGQHLAGQKVDHVAITGDIGNVSLVGEWKAGLRWIQRYGGRPERVTVIPGNHDAYVRDVVASSAFERLFEPYQTGERAAARSDGGEHLADSRESYPFVRLLGRLVLVAVNTCVPTGDLGAWGQIGDRQLRRLESMLADPQFKNRQRVVLLHHPPVVHKHGEERNLRDRDAFAAVLAKVGADLVLHGHDHRDEVATLRGPLDAPVPVVGAGSASYAGAPAGRARYNIYEFSDGHIGCVTYAHDKQTDAFVQVDRKVLV